MKALDSLDLFRLVYRSHSALDGTVAEMQDTIASIVEISQQRNSEAGVTGALMFTRLFFIQALEGPSAAVESTFDRICCDLRHDEVEIIECGPIMKRGFGTWSMSHLVPDPSTGAMLARVDNATDLADAAAAAMKLMAALLTGEALRIEAASKQSA